MHSLIDLSSPHVRDLPFDCFTAERVISEQVEAVLLDWLENEAKWELAETDFYEQYEIRFCEVELPPSLRFLVSDELVEYLRGRIGCLLGASLSKRAEITAHQLRSGQTIRIHNDFRPCGESFRFLIQLNRGWSDEQGGLLMLFRDSTTASLDCIIPPHSGSGFGFRISQNSHHAVSKVHGGNRFTVVYSFYDADHD